MGRNLPSSGGVQAILPYQDIVIHTPSVYTRLVKGEDAVMRHRINITLPRETVQLIDRVAKAGERSRLIDEAVRDYVSRRSRLNLKKQLREGAVKRAERDLQQTQEWFFLDEEAWQEADH